MRLSGDFKIMKNRNPYWLRFFYAAAFILK